MPRGRSTRSRAGSLGHGYDGAVQRLLPALVAFALIIVGVGGGIFLLAGRDGSSIQQEAPVTPRAVTGPQGLPVGNVLIEYQRSRDGIRIDQLAERLGAIDTEATRIAGQAVVARRVDTGPAITARTGSATIELDDATDPKLEAFVLEHLGRTGP